MAAQTPITYKIIKKEIKVGSEETIFTTVTYDINGSQVTVEIPHFMPDSLIDIQANIDNRALSEERRKNAIDKNNLIIAQIVVDQSLGAKIEN